MRPDWPARDPHAAAAGANRSPSRSPSPQPSPSPSGGGGKVGGGGAGGGAGARSRSNSLAAASAASGSSNLAAASGNNNSNGRAPPPIGETPVPTNDNFKVVVRVRPPLARELGHPRGYSPAVRVDACGRALTLSEDPGVVANSSSSSSSSLGGESNNSNSNSSNQHLLYATHRFAFDAVHPPSATQEDVYLASARPSVRAVLAGYNAAIIAYGQTGAGKTHTMEGEPEGEQRGIVPRAVADAFAGIEADDVVVGGGSSSSNSSSPSNSSSSSNSTTAPARFLVRASYLQIYNETISDLLKPERTNLAIREDARRGGVFVEGLSEWVVRSPAEVHALMARGRAVRATGATRMNEASSRSHAVLTITIERCAAAAAEGGGGAAAAAAAAAASSSSSSSSRKNNSNDSSSAAVRVGKLHLVDLAGSERVAITGATGKRLQESKRINASLSALGNVIAALTAHSSSKSNGSDPPSTSSASSSSSSGRAPRSHIPYRDSKLTRLLEDSLGGNCVTTLVATVSPSSCAFSESLSTLKFATRAKAVSNAPRVNEELDGDGTDSGSSRTLLRRYEAELRRLRAELRERSRTLVDKRALLELEEGRRRAEADKLAAIEALEQRSAEVARAKAEKRALEARIGAMQSQLLVGGSLAGGGGGGELPRGKNGRPLSVEDTEQFRSRLDQEHRRIRGEYERRLRELEGDRQAAVADRAQADRYVALLLRQRDIMTGLTSRLAERDGQLSSLREEVELYDGRIQRLEDALDARTAELLALRRAAAERRERDREEEGGGGGGRGSGAGPRRQQQHQAQNRPRQQQRHPPPLPLPPTVVCDNGDSASADEVFKSAAAERFAAVVSLTASAVDETLPPAPPPPPPPPTTTTTQQEAAATTKTKSAAAATPSLSGGGSVSVLHHLPSSPSPPAPRSSSSSVSATPVAFVAAPPSLSSSRRSSGGGSSSRRRDDSGGDVLRRLLGSS